MRGHPPAPDYGRMDLAPARYMIRINGHLGATMLSAFPALAPQHHGAHTVLTGLLDQSALYGVLANHLDQATITHQPGHNTAKGDLGVRYRRRIEVTGSRMN